MPRNVVLQLLVDIKQFAQGLNSAATTAQSTFGKIGQMAGNVGGAIGRVAGSVSGMAKGFNILGGEVIRSTVFFAAYYNALQGINALMRGAVGQIFSLDSALHDLQFATGATKAEMMKFRQELIDAERQGKLFGANAAEVAQSMLAAVRAHYSAADALNIVKLAAKAASGGLVSVNDATQGTVRVLNALQLPATAAERVLSLFISTMEAGDMTFAQAEENIVKLAATAGFLKVPLEDLSTILDVLVKRGIPATTAFTFIQRAMQNLATPTKAAAKAAAEFGITLNPATLAARGMVGMLIDIERATNGDAQAFKKILPDMRSLRGMEALMADGGAELIKSFEDMGLSEEKATELARYFAIQSDTLRYKLKLLGTQLMALVDVGGASTTMFGKILDGISHLIASGSPIVDFIKNIVIELIALVGIIKVFEFAVGALNPWLFTLTVLLAALPILMAELHVTWGDLFHKVERFTDAVLRHTGAMDHLREALDGIKYALWGIRHNDFTEVGFGLAVILHAFTGIKYTAPDIIQKFKELYVAALYVGQAFNRLEKGNLKGFAESIRHAFEAAFGKSIGDKVFGFFAGVVRFVRMVGTVLKEVFTSKLFIELLKDFAAGLKVIAMAAGFLFVAVAKFFDFIGHHKIAMYAFLAVLVLWSGVLGSLPLAFIAVAVAIGYVYRHWTEWEKRFPILQALTDAFKEGLRVLWHWTNELGHAIEKYVLPALKKFGEWIVQHKAFLYALIAVLLVLVALWVGPMVLAILAVITAIGMLSERWDNLKLKTITIWNEIKTFLFGVWESIRRFFQDTLGINLVGVWKRVWKEICDEATIIWTAIKALFHDGLRFILDVFHFFTDLFHGRWGKLWNDAKDIVADVFHLIWDIIKMDLELWWSRIKFVLGMITEVFAGAWNWIKDKTEQIWDRIWSSIKDRLNRIRNFFHEHFTLLYIIVHGALMLIWSAFKIYLEHIWTEVKIAFHLIRTIIGPILKQIWTDIRLWFDIVVNVFRFFMDIINGDWRAAWHDLQRILSDAWELIKTTVSTALTVLGGIITFALSTIRNVAGGIWEEFTSAFSTAFNTVKDGVLQVLNDLGSGIEKGLNFIIDMINDFLGPVSKVWNKVASLWGGGGSMPSHIGHVNFMGTGGEESFGGNGPDPAAIAKAFGHSIRAGATGIRNFAGGLAWVGEKGIELVRLPRGADVVAHGDVGQTLRAAQGNNTTINAEVHLNTGLLSEWEELKKRAMDEMSKKLDDAAARANLSRPRYGTFGAGIPRP